MSKKIEITAADILRYVEKLQDKGLSPDAVIISSKKENEERIKEISLAGVNLTIIPNDMGKICTVFGMNVYCDPNLEPDQILIIDTKYIKVSEPKRSLWQRFKIWKMQRWFKKQICKAFDIKESDLK